MMKYKSLVIIGTICLIASCKKTTTHYYQAYSVQYNVLTDSYVVAAGYINNATSTPVYLASNESVDFNGTPYTETIAATCGYVWRGKGKVSGTFTLKKKKAEFKNSISISTLPDYQILCPDTIDKAKNFVVRIKNYTPVPNHITVYLSADRTTLGNGFTGDSVVFTASHTKDLKSGAGKIDFRYSYQETVPNQDESSGGQIGYMIEAEKAVWVK